MKRNRKACRGKFRWPTIQAAQSFCFHKRQAGIHIQAYHCRFCGGIHVGHFRGDELPELETTMSKTRVYAVFCDGTRISGVYLAREEAEEERASYARVVVCEKDIDEEEYAAMAIDYMEQDSRRRTWERNPVPGSLGPNFDYSLPQTPPADSWMSPEGWTDCSTRPPEPGPKRKPNG